MCPGMINNLGKALLLFVLTILTGNILLSVYLHWNHYSMEEFFGALALTSLYSLHLLFLNFLFYRLIRTFKPFPPYNYISAGLYGLAVSIVHILSLIYFLGNEILQFSIPFLIMAPISAMLVELITYGSDQAK